MARVNRREILADGEVQVLFCVNRCGFRRFLCGKDPLTGMDYEHRRQWVRRRLEFLAGVFGVDVLAFSVLADHMNVILRNRPDVVKTWADGECARRWWSVFPGRRQADGSPAEPAEAELRSLTANAALRAELRSRLSSVSWFMRCSAEVIARMANAEEECSGRFWEGRFKARILSDEASIAACMVYVDQTPATSGAAKKQEPGKLTSALERIADLIDAEKVATPDAREIRTEHGPRAGWLAPVELEPKRKKVREKVSDRRASNDGCVQLSLSDYLCLVRWTGQQLDPGKRRAVTGGAEEASLILERRGVTPDVWLQSIRQFGRTRSVNRATPKMQFDT